MKKQTIHQGTPGQGTGRRHMQSILRLGVLGVGIALAGCGGIQKIIPGDGFSREARQANPAPCPETLVLRDAARFVEFNGDEKLENITFTGEILNVSAACRYFGDKPIEAEITLDFAFGRGPAATSRATEVAYFVTVTRRDSDLIAKKEFSIPVKFGTVGKDGLAQVKLRERIGDIVIPRKDSNVAGRNFEIIVGLALTKDQLRFNRNGTSLKFPDLPDL